MLPEWVRRLNRAQQSTMFKIIASAVLTALAIAAVVTYVVLAHAPAAAGATPGPAGAGVTGSAPTEALARTAAELASRRQDPTDVAIGTGALLVVGLVVVWLGVGLTYLGLLAAAVVIVAPMILFGEKRVLISAQDGGAVLTVRGLGQFLAGVMALSAAFTAMVQGLRMLLSAGGRVCSIARNVVDEAVRLRVSLVFMVLLVLGLAALPGLLDPTTPLRYRMQSFLQYGTGGSFWIIATVVVFLAVATVSFEQRDRVIWQTMTKPVTAWQYVLGKWLGVSGIAAVLLAVTASGVFLFSSYLRFQPAQDENRAFESKSGFGWTEDRKILETQVLAARVGVKPSFDPPDSESLAAGVVDRLLKEHTLGDVEDTPQIRDAMQDAIVRRWGVPSHSSRASGLDGKTLARAAQLVSDGAPAVDRARADLLREYADRQLSIPGATETDPTVRGQDFQFRGLQDGKALGQPLALRYKINAGGDDPRGVYTITFITEGPAVFDDDDSQTVLMGPTRQQAVPYSVIVKQVPPAQTLVLRLSPEAVRADGTLRLTVFNGDRPRGIPTMETVTFPPDGLELFYTAGSYRMNFLRVMLVLWMKLAFLAMIGVACGTFLSFPVASLVAFGIFLLAETSSFLAESLEYYASRSKEGNIILWKVAVRALAVPVAYGLKFYADLRPTANLVDGRLVAWTGVAQTVLVLGSVTAVIYVAGCLIFRRRELAIYSGH